MLRKISPAAFGLCLVCFFMPFTEISCANQRIARFSGIQLAMGTTIKVPSSPFSKVKAESREVAGSPFLVAALISAALGLLFSFLKGRAGRILSALMGVAGAVLILIYKVNADHEALREGEGLLQVDFLFGFWLALLFYLLAFGVNVSLFASYGREKISDAKVSSGRET